MLGTQHNIDSLNFLPIRHSTLFASLRSLAFFLRLASSVDLLRHLHLHSQPPSCPMCRALASRAVACLVLPCKQRLSVSCNPIKFLIYTVFATPASHSFQLQNFRPDHSSQNDAVSMFASPRRSHLGPSILGAGYSPPLISIAISSRRMSTSANAIVVVVAHFTSCVSQRRHTDRLLERCPSPQPSRSKTRCTDTSPRRVPLPRLAAVAAAGPRAAASRHAGPASLAHPRVGASDS
jgi:hypothetical protein